MKILVFVCFFTFLIHLTESLSYCMRYAGLKTKQVAISMSFVTSTLLVSRLSNMFQAPLLGNMVDKAVKSSSHVSLELLMHDFRIIILSASLGTFFALLLTPSFVNIFKIAIKKFLEVGSLPKMAIMSLHPKNMKKIIQCFTLPKVSMLKGINFHSIPKVFLILNIVVTAVYTIGVLCSLYAGANLPDLRATAVQLSGIVNGVATILLTLIVDPEGARITDQAVHKVRPESDVKTVVVSLLLTRLIGTLIIAQLFFLPATKYIMFFTKFIAENF